ncbi:hypothetical protein RND71_039851 [Anisodus tanguticus]|uniref:Cyclin-dependent kinase inhibitor domain-containing protein n=1 Tax=Anisodus tanguticus TaxID=243964 RepID=A0AAE1UY65_9SOLA|nr:hypothetical protein RND71_039851 [Anisodus tanguticus]
MMLSGELESTKRPKSENSHRRITPAKMAKHENSPRRIMPEKVPSRNEIEEFFAACEKDMFKRFREKYNFDFEKEEPLEGRNEWPTNDKNEEDIVPIQTSKPILQHKKESRGKSDYYNKKNMYKDKKNKARNVTSRFIERNKQNSTTMIKERE